MHLLFTLTAILLFKFRPFQSIDATARESVRQHVPVRCHRLTVGLIADVILNANIASRVRNPFEIAIIITVIAIMFRLYVRQRILP